MAEALEQWHQVALLELSLINLNKVRDSLDDDAPAALQQKLTVAYAKIDAAREFIEQGWIRCPKCNRVSYRTKTTLRRSTAQIAVSSTISLTQL